MNLDHLTIPGRPGARMSAFTDDVLGTADAVELAGRVASGDVTSAELVDAAIARAERVNPDLNAIATWDVERAREQAGDDTPDGVLGGVPTFIKGLSAYAGLPHRWGSRAPPATPESAAPTTQPYQKRKSFPAFAISRYSLPTNTLATLSPVVTIAKTNTA